MSHLILTTLRGESSPTRELQLREVGKRVRGHKASKWANGDFKSKPVLLMCKSNTTGRTAPFTQQVLWGWIYPSISAFPKPTPLYHLRVSFFTCLRFFFFFFFSVRWGKSLARKVILRIRNDIFTRPDTCRL